MDGQVLNTFCEACLEHGLLENDRHWEETLAEAEACRVPKQRLTADQKLAYDSVMHSINEKKGGMSLLMHQVGQKKLF